MAEIEKKKEKSDGKVDLFVPLGGTKDEPNLLIGVNGKMVLLPKGKTSRVAPEIAEEYYRSQKAAAKYARERMERRYQEKSGGMDPLK